MQATFLQHKETKRIVAAIRSGGMPTFASHVNVGSWGNFLLVAKQVAAECPTIAVMLGAIEETPRKALYIAASMPKQIEAQSSVEVSSSAWIDASLACGARDEVSTAIEVQDADLIVVGITYKEDSSQSPFKLIDQVFGMGTAYLKQANLYQEEEEEYEYGFDDI